MRRILMLLTNAFDPDPRVYQEARALVEHDYEVTVLCWDRDYKKPEKEIVDSINVERIYIKSTHGRGTTQIVFLFLFWLKAFLRACFKKFNYFHCHDFDTLPLGYLLAKLKGARLIYDAHESYVDMLINVPAWLKTIIYKCENYFLKRTDLVITVGEILKDAFIKRGAKTTCVVGNWKDPEKFQFPKDIIEEEKKRLGIHNGQVVISFIANLGEERQVPQLIEAIKDIPHAFLVIGGDGPCRDRVEDASRRFPNIRYLGYVNPFKIPLYTALADIIFYGFDPTNPNAKYSAPNKLFEAIAAGKPIITGDFGEIGRIVRENKCGIVLDNYSSKEIKRTFDDLDANTLSYYHLKAKAATSLYNWHNAQNILLQSYHNLST